MLFKSKDNILHFSCNKAPTSVLRGLQISTRAVKPISSEPNWGLMVGDLG